MDAGHVRRYLLYYLAADTRLDDRTHSVETVTPPQASRSISHSHLPSNSTLTTLVALSFSLAGPPSSSDAMQTFAVSKNTVSVKGGRVPALCRQD